MTVPKLEITPGRGIGPVELGMSTEQVEAALLAIGCLDLDPTGRPEFDRAFANSLQVNYEPPSNQCSRVGIYWHPSCGCECWFDGKRVAEYDAEDLFLLLARLDGEQHTFSHQQSYVFSNIQVQLHDLSPVHDYRENGTRLVYGEIGIGDVPWIGFAQP